MSKKPIKLQFYSALKWIGWVLLVQFILINICAALYAHKLTHFYEGLPPQRSTDEMNIFSKSWKIFSGPKYAKYHGEDRPNCLIDSVSLVTHGGLHIAGWYEHTDSVSKGTVIMFHGIGGDKSTLIDEAAAFRSLGYNVLLIDFRGHGSSDGSNTTIGYRESEEVNLSYNYIRSKGEQHIILYGSSMGAVTVTRAIYDYSIKPEAIILEMPFKSLQSYLKGKARVLGFPNQPFAFLTTFWIGVERGINGFRHCTTRYVQSIHCPVLMQWGSYDNLVLENETRSIYEAIASPNKKLVVYPGALHESLLRKDPLRWRIEVGRFMASNH